MTKKKVCASVGRAEQVERDSKKTKRVFVYTSECSTTWWRDKQTTWLVRVKCEGKWRGWQRGGKQNVTISMAWRFRAMVRRRDERATWLLRATCEAGGVINSVIKMPANVSNECGSVMCAGKEKRETADWQRRNR